MIGGIDSFDHRDTSAKDFAKEHSHRIRLLQHMYINSLNSPAIPVLSYKLRSYRLVVNETSGYRSRDQETPDTAPTIRRQPSNGSPFRGTREGGA